MDESLREILTRHWSFIVRYLNPSDEFINALLTEKVLPLSMIDDIKKCLTRPSSLMGECENHSIQLHNSSQADNYRKRDKRVRSFILSNYAAVLPSEANQEKIEEEPAILNNMPCKYPKNFNVRQRHRLERLAIKQWHNAKIIPSVSALVDILTKNHRKKGFSFSQIKTMLVNAGEITSTTNDCTVRATLDTAIRARRIKKVYPENNLRRASCSSRPPRSLSVQRSKRQIHKSHKYICRNRSLTPSVRKSRHDHRARNLGSRRSIPMRRRKTPGGRRSISKTGSAGSSRKSHRYRSSIRRSSKCRYRPKYSDNQRSRRSRNYSKRYR